MHNKEKSKSTSNLLKKSNPSSPVKTEVGESSEMDEKSPSNPNKQQNSPTVHHRRRAKRSSSHHHSLLSTVSSVHELMSFVIYKDRPPQWLKQTEIYREYLNKSSQVHLEPQSSESLHPQFHQPSHRKQRSNLHLYTQIDSSPTKLNGFTATNGSIKHENLQMTSPAKKRKNSSSGKTRRQEQVLCKKILEENGSTPRRARRARSNSVENREPIEKKESSSSSSSLSTSSSSSQLDSSNASLSSIEHTSPSPTTTASHRSSPSEYMRCARTSPMRSFSPPLPSSTPQRRSTRLWAPSSFYINPMWILPSGSSSSSSSKRNLSFSPTTESVKRPRRRCRS